MHAEVDVWPPLRDKIRNHEFREKLGVAPIFAKMRENRLRWFGYVQRRTFDVPVGRIENIMIEGKRGRGKPKRTLEEQIKIDLHELHISKDLTRSINESNKDMKAINEYILT